MNLNKAMLIGRLTRDPEMRYLPSGQAVTSFGIATNRYGTDQAGERKEFTDFHNIVAWNQGKRNLAEICSQYLRKGALVYIEGRIQTRSWEGQDGQKRTRTEINANDVQFLDSRSGGAAAGDQGGSDAGIGDDFAATTGAPAAQAAAVPAAESQDIDPDDIPF
jgi:single-strand DNA-binding protein